MAFHFSELDEIHLARERDKVPECFECLRVLSEEKKPTFAIRQKPRSLPGSGVFVLGACGYPGVPDQTPGSRERSARIPPSPCRVNQVSPLAVSLHVLTTRCSPHCSP